MKKSLAIIAMMAALCTACSDDDKGCTEGNVTCDGQTLVKCKDGVEIKTVCDSGRVCSAVDGRCVEAATGSGNEMPVCEEYADGTVMKTRVKYCSDHFYSYTDCGTNGCSLNENNVASCDKPVTKACEEGETRCNIEGVKQTCSADGKWVDDPCCAAGDASCELTCEDGVCKGGCIEGETRCYDAGNGGVIQQICQADGKWKSSNPGCTGATPLCVNGQCVADDYVPKAGEVCGSFVSKCQEYAGGTLYTYCSGSEDGSVSAANSIAEVQTCNADDSYACTAIDGVDKCVLDIPTYSEYCKTSADDGRIFFQDSCDESGLIYLQCHAADNGNTYSEQLYVKSLCHSGQAVTCEDGDMVAKTCQTCEVKGQYAYCDGVKIEFGGGSSSGGSTGGDSSSWSECTSEDMCSATQTCAELCAEYYGSEYKAWCDNTDQVQCSPTQPSGGSSSGGSATCDAIDCSSEQLSSGETLLAACQEAYPGTNMGLCVLDGSSLSGVCATRDESSDSLCNSGEVAFTDDGETYCLTIGSDESCFTGGGSSSGSSASWSECTSEDMCSSTQTCTELCAEYYGSEYKAWCDANSDDVSCSPTQPSGGSTSSGSKATCDFVDATTDEYVAKCKATMSDADTVVCDDESCYCLKRNEAGDAECTDGGKSYTYQLSAGGTDSDCFIVGKSEACLTGETYEECASDEMCSSTQTCADVCKGYDATYKAWCSTSSTSVLCDTTQPTPEV